MDVFAEIQGAQQEPELLPARQRREVQAQADEILNIARSGTAIPDPVLLLICQEFAKRPRKDWAGQIQAWHKAHTAQAEKAVAEFKVMYPPLTPDMVPIPLWLRNGEDDLESILERTYAPLNIRISLPPAQDRTFYWALSRDVNWRWLHSWRRITTARFQNGTNCVWGSLEQEWDVKRVDWDEISRNNLLRWKPLPLFTRDTNGGGEYADILITERRQS